VSEFDAHRWGHAISFSVSGAMLYIISGLSSRMKKVEIREVYPEKILQLADTERR
jgi:uncharacterized protein YggU (UPF0235/DUF167 family)